MERGQNCTSRLSRTAILGKFVEIMSMAFDTTLKKRQRSREQGQYGFFLLPFNFLLLPCSVRDHFPPFPAPCLFVHRTIMRASREYAPGPRTAIAISMTQYIKAFSQLGGSPFPKGPLYWSSGIKYGSWATKGLLPEMSK